MNINEPYIGFNPNRNIIASDDYSINSSEILATTKCVASALADYSSNVSTLFPSLADAVSITAVSGTSNTYTAPYDGFISIHGSTSDASTQGAITITVSNSDNVMLYAQTFTNAVGVNTSVGAFLPVPKGGKATYQSFHIATVGGTKFIKASRAVS